MRKVFLVDGKRSPIGSFLGSLRFVHPADLGAEVVKGLLEKNEINPDDIDEVIVGNILPAGLGQGMGRQVSIKAGIKQEIPAYSLNMVCGSGMKAVMNAFANIQAGMHHLVIAGGVESMSNAPFLVSSKTRDGVKMGDFNLVDHMIYDALTDVFNNVHMGITAENIAEKFQITREAQDDFAIESQKKAIASVDNGRFADEIIPIVIKTKKGDIIVDKDEYPNRTTSREKLSMLRPAFKKDGVVTAGNASGINDGASFTIVASEEYVRKNQLQPLFEIVAVGQGGVDPLLMGLGPVPAIRNALKMAKMRLQDMELLELNEAFAAQSLGVIKLLAEEHQMSEEAIKQITNINGGAIALGHPVGASGNRILVTLMHEMKKQNLTYGLASLCIGGGMGTAIIIKRV
ncbi:MAG: acetyl-CoA C-acetyltransferase [Bacilli bacterium]|jgi:acetyl-CoA C-acetyltransferase|nr:acetyl-CoA C-acetyltransferase [Bacilli bacterium]